MAALLAVLLTRPEPAPAPMRIATAVAAALAAVTADSLDDEALGRIERALLDLSDAIGNRFFLQGRERASGMTRLA